MASTKPVMEKLEFCCLFRSYEHHTVERGIETDIQNGMRKEIAVKGSRVNDVFLI